MNKYTKLAIGNIVLTIFTVISFDNISELLNGEFIPFILVLLFGISAIASVVLRGSVWYRADLADRTIEELENIEKSDVVEE